MQTYEKECLPMHSSILCTNAASFENDVMKKNWTCKRSNKKLACKTSQYMRVMGILEAP